MKTRPIYRTKDAAGRTRYYYTLRAGRLEMPVSHDDFVVATSFRGYRVVDVRLQDRDDGLRRFVRVS